MLWLPPQMLEFDAQLARGSEYPVLLHKCTLRESPYAVFPVRSLIIKIITNLYVLYHFHVRYHYK